MAGLLLVFFLILIGDKGMESGKKGNIGMWDD